MIVVVGWSEVGWVVLMVDISDNNCYESGAEREEWQQLISLPPSLHPHTYWPRAGVVRLWKLTINPSVHQ
jgi:hypothetical protein